MRDNFEVNDFGFSHSHMDEVEPISASNHVSESEATPMPFNIPFLAIYISGDLRRRFEAPNFQTATYFHTFLPNVFGSKTFVNCCSSCFSKNDLSSRKLVPNSGSMNEYY